MQGAGHATNLEMSVWQNRPVCMQVDHMSQGYKKDSNRKAWVPQPLALQGFRGFKRWGLGCLCPAKLTLLIVPLIGGAHSQLLSLCPPGKVSGRTQESLLGLPAGPRAIEPRMQCWCTGLLSHWSINWLPCPIHEVLVYFLVILSRLWGKDSTWINRIFLLLLLAVRPPVWLM